MRRNSILVFALLANGSAFAQQTEPQQRSATATETGRPKDTSKWLDAGALAAYVVGAATLAVTVLFSLRAHADAKAADASARLASQHAERANQHAERANALNARVWADQYFQSVRAWADEAIANLAMAIHLNDFGSELQTARLIEVRAALSGLVDRGRWYFPNRFDTEIGQHKGPAFRGLRQPVLEYLVQAYEALDKNEALGDQQTRSALVRAERRFVSEVQRILDPRTREKQIDAVLEDFRVAEILRSDSGGSTHESAAAATNRG